MQNNLWEENEKILKKELDLIFKDKDLLSMSDYEKRKTVFNYLVNCIRYDYAKLGLLVKTNNKLRRDSQKEFREMITNKKGVCNIISQYYKILLEMLGIESYCFICDNMMPVYHELNLVYDKDTNKYSFDDVTSAIVFNRKKAFFDYDIKAANRFGQGIRMTTLNKQWVYVPDYITSFSSGKKYEMSRPLESLPEENISRVRTRKGN